MSSSPDLKIVDQAVRDTYEKLDGVCADFTSDATSAADIGPALGHPDLAEKLKSFSDSWRVNREHMVATFESLSKELRQKLDIFEQLDKEMGGEGDDSKKPNPVPVPEPTPQPPKNDPDPRTKTDPTTVSPLPPGSTTKAPVDVPHQAADLPSAASDTSSGSAHVADGVSGTASQQPLGDSASNVTVDTDNGSFVARAAFGVGGGAAAAATLTGLYRVWERAQAAKSGSTATPMSDSDIDSRASLLQEFERMHLGNGEGTVELVSDPKNPADVLAILQGKDGSTSELKFGDLDGSRTAPDSTGSSSTPDGSSAADPQSGTSSPIAADTAQSDHGTSSQATPLLASQSDSDAGLSGGSSGGASSGALSGSPSGAGLGGSLPTASSSGLGGGGESPAVPVVDLGTGASTAPDASAAPDFSQGKVQADLGASPSHAMAGGMMGAGMTGMAAASSASSSKHDRERSAEERRLDPLAKPSGQKDKEHQ